MSFTNEQVAQLIGAIQHSAGKRLSSKLDKALSKKGAKFNFDNLMSTISNANADREAPRKPANAWQLFLREYREGGEVEPGMNGAEIVAKASPVWKGMSADDKKPFEEEAAKLSADYRQAKEAVKPAKVDSGPSRPKNSWMLFLTQYRAEHKAEGVAGSAIVTAAGEVWKGMSADDKKPFEDKANAAMVEYKNYKKDNGVDHDGVDHDGVDHDGVDHDGVDHDEVDHDELVEAKPKKDKKKGKKKVDEVKEEVKVDEVKEKDNVEEVNDDEQVEEVKSKKKKSKKKKDTVEEEFNKIDKNHDGVISLDEFKAAQKSK